MVRRIPPLPNLRKELIKFDNDSCKPQMAQALLKAPGMSEALENKLLISILAGTTISMMTEWVPKSCTVVRSMPNTPTKVRHLFH
jgi:pyrroline-5-carboxylate reductase